MTLKNSKELHGVICFLLIDPEWDVKECKSKDPQSYLHDPPAVPIHRLMVAGGAAELCKALSNTENKPYSTLEG